MRKARILQWRGALGHQWHCFPANFLSQDSALLQILSEIFWVTQLCSNALIWFLNDMITPEPSDYLS